MNCARTGCVLTLNFLIAIASELNSAETCQFRRRTVAVGDVARQTIVCDLDLTIAMTQDNQIIDSAQQSIQRELTRTMKVMATGQTAPTKALVKFEKASLGMKQTKSKDVVQTDQPISGKSYLVSRRGEELHITDPNGKAPPESELSILRTNLDTFGRPNPIGEFFHGKTMRVGQSITLPAELARELLGLSDGIGNVSKLGMKLAAIRTANGQDTAEFDVELIAETPQPQGMQMKLNGQLTLEIATCRTLAVKLTGPVAVEEQHGPDVGKFSVESNGDLRMAVQATYDPPVR